MNLPCLNCKKEVEQNAGKFFAEVFLCDGCCVQAEHFFNRLVKELQYLLTMAKESIRVALVQGKFVFPEAPAGEPTKRAVLESILQMEERRERIAKEKAWSTASTDSMLAPAAGPDVEALESSSKDSPPA
jgi:hypothetical protein